MKLSFSRIALAPLFALALVPATGCSEAPAPAPAPEPRPLDLTTLAPRVETADGEPTEIEAASLLPGLHAWKQAEADPGGVWIVDRLLGAGWRTPSQTRAKLINGGQIRTLEHPPDLRVVWTLTIPQDAHLTFRPRRAACPLSQRLEIRHGQATQTLVDLALSPAPSGEGQFGPAEEIVDLSPWAGREVELVASGETADPGCRDTVIGWGTPLVWSDRAAKRTRGLLERLPWRERPAQNVVLLGLDTVRADHLGAWGRSPSPTPALDRLAAQSDVFPQAFATFNVTTPSFVSIHTGLYGKHHGVYRLGTPADPAIHTLAESFRDAGYATQSVVAATHLRPTNSGLGQGFDGAHSPWGQWAAEEVVRRGLAWVGEVETVDAPFFLWLHLFDPHTPQTPPLPYARGRAPDGVPGLGPVGDWHWLRPEGLLPYADPHLGAHPVLYDDELAYMDRQIGRLMDALDHRGVLESTWVVVVADHGENLGEHGLTCRHAGLWDTTTHVPLMIRPPGPWQGDETRAGRRLDGLVQTIDLFPTLLRRVGLPVPPSDGQDLYELAERGGRRAVFAEHSHGAGSMVRTADHLLYRHVGSELTPNDDVETGIYLYDLESDPRQEENLAGTGHPDEARLLRLLDAWSADRDRTFESGESALDEEEKERLRALGYLE